MNINKISHWQIIDKALVQENKNYIGYVYKIVFENGNFYYGSKLLRRRKTLKYSNKFLTYFSSSKYVKELLEKDIKAKFYIIKFFTCFDCCYNEEQILIKKYIKNEKCLNKSCFNIPYGSYTITEKTRLKMSNSAKNKNINKISRKEIYKKVSKTLKTRKHTSEHNANVSKNKLHSKPIFYEYILVNNIRYKSIRDCSIKTGESQFIIKSKIENKNEENYLGILKNKELKREPRPQKMLYYNKDVYTSLSVLKKMHKNIDFKNVTPYINQDFNKVYFKKGSPVVYNNIVYISIEKLCEELKVSRPYFFKNILNTNNCYLITGKD